MARASPTPTGCTQSHPERPQWHRCRRGGQRHPQPPGTISHPPQGRRAAHAAGGGAGLPSHPRTLTAPPDAPQATTGGTGCGASTRRTPCPQRAHRCPTERGAGEGRSYPPTAPRRATAAQDDPQTVRPYLYEYGSTAQPRTWKPARRNG